MKKLKIAIIFRFLGLIFLFLSCESVGCEKVLVESFSSFLTVTPNTPEKELKKIFGNASGGSYTDDKKVFIHEFHNIERVPVQVFVNSKSGEIETIFMEILGQGLNYSRDMKKAKSNFPISDCHFSMFGKKPEEIINLLGPPMEDNFTKDNVETNVRALRYYSADKKISVRLNFYPSQNYKMSSVVVDWY